MKQVIGMRASVLAAVLVLAGGLSVNAGIKAVGRIHEFGFVGIDYDLFHVFPLVNTGTQPLYVDSVRVNCDCSFVTCGDSVIAPGDTGRVRLKFNTRNYYGPTSKVISVYWHEKEPAKLELFYKSIVGQWYFGLKPNPQSLFFLPKNKEKKVIIPNPEMKEIKVAEIHPEDTLFTVEPVKKTAGKGEKLEFIVRPRPGLPTGTYLSSFTIKLDLPLDLDPAYLSIPVKIVRF